jgi:EmrB/QacA subfamily drug resistance transporter
MSHATSAPPPTHTPPAHAARAPHGPEAPHSWVLLVLLAVAEFMVVLDVTVVNLALPTIADAFALGEGRLSWVVTAYVLFTGGLMLLGGRLADLTDRRAVFLAGLGLFTGASLASGLAWSGGALIVARALQGAGAALLLPAALSIVTTAYTGRQRAIALTVWSALGSAGAAAGVLLGGVLVTLLDWRWIFFVNVPVGIALAVLAPRVIAAAPARRPAVARLDLLGAGTLMAGLVSLVLAIEGTGEHGWTSGRTLGLAALAALLLAAFAAVERSVGRPLVPPATWRRRSLVSGASMMLAATGVLVGAFFLGSLYLQRTLGATALETGLAFLPLALVILAGAHMTQHLLPKLGTRAPMAAGLALAAGGALLLSRAPAEASYAVDLLPGFVALGFGVGMALVAVSVVTMDRIAHEEGGLASGLLSTAHELGAAIGVAVLAAVTAAGGIGDAFTVSAAVAGAGALAALVAVPSARPEPGARIAAH